MRKWLTFRDVAVVDFSPAYQPPSFLAAANHLRDRAHGSIIGLCLRVCALDVGGFPREVLVAIQKGDRCGKREICLLRGAGSRNSMCMASQIAKTLERS